LIVKRHGALGTSTAAVPTIWRSASAALARTGR